MDRVYVCIDLKSFYASVECQQRGLDPITTNLVVADPNRTEKTICLAVTPSLKSYGIPGRARLFEVIAKVKNINYERKKHAGNYRFLGKSYNLVELKNNPNLELDYIIAPPQMKKYIEYSTKIYNIYLKYLSKDDVYVYSIDEVFCDITNYLKCYKLTAKELTTKMIHDVYNTTGITATAGIGTNMYLCKVAMDIVAKHTEPDKNGVRIASLDEMSYRKLLWSYRPLTDFWRVGRGYAQKLEKQGLNTMGDIARCSINNEDLLYKIFGINAELLIDHAWGYEPCTMEDIKNYKPITNSISTGQVLHSPYNYEKAKIIVREMIDSLILDLVAKKLVTNQIFLIIGYDIGNLLDPDIMNKYDGEIVTDYYGRSVPKQAHGTVNLDLYTSSASIIMKSTIDLYDKIINKHLLIRRINIAALNTMNESITNKTKLVKQMDLFTNAKNFEIEQTKKQIELVEEKKLQNVILDIKKKYGKNAILKGTDLQKGATTIDRNNQIGGHKA